MKKKKIVYAGLAADILHQGHINILKKASKLGKVVVGLLTDQAIASYKKLPLLNYQQREAVIRDIKYVPSLKGFIVILENIPSIGFIQSNS